MPKNKKGQAAMEYLSTIGIAFFILMGLITFSYFWTSASKEQMHVSTARSSVNAIVEAADVVYAQGYPAKNTVLIQVPDSVQTALIRENEVLFRMRTSGGGVTDVFAVSKANLTGSIPSESGCYKIEVQAFGDHVNVTQKS